MLSIYWKNQYSVFDRDINVKHIFRYMNGQYIIEISMQGQSQGCKNYLIFLTQDIHHKLIIFI